MYWLYCTLLALILVLLPVLPAQAARKFTSGCEEGAMTTTTLWSTVSAGASVENTTRHSGSSSCKLSGTTGKTFIFSLAASVGTGVIEFPEFYWRTNATGSDSRLFSDTSSTSVSGAEVYKLTGGTIQLKNAIASTTVNSSMTVSVDTWYRFAVKHVISDSAGYLVLKIFVGDATTASETLVLGADDESGTNAVADTLPSNILFFTFSESANSNSLTYLLDDIRLNDDSGTFQTSYPGPGKIYMLVPDSNVAMQWEDESAPTPTGGENSATFANINELPGALDDTSYNMADPLNDAADTLANDPIDQMGLTNLGAEVPSDAVLAVVAVYARVGSNQTSAANMRLKLWDDVSALTTGTTINANVNGWKSVNANQQLSYNASGKSKAQLDSFNVGYDVLTDTLVARPRRISALWVNVEWIEAGGARRGTLLGVSP